jgi:hypothetical protein
MALGNGLPNKPTHLGTATATTTSALKMRDCMLYTRFPWSTSARGCYGLSVCLSASNAWVAGTVRRQIQFNTSCDFFMQSFFPTAHVFIFCYQISE